MSGHIGSSPRTSYKPIFNLYSSVVMCQIVIAAWLFQRVQAVAATDRTEVAILNTVAKKMGIASWNFNVDPCQGQDGWSLSTNKGISCDCKYANNTICHVTQVRVYAQNVVGVVPKELAQLAYLSSIDLRQNILSGPIPMELGLMTQLKYLNLSINNLSGSIPKELGNLVNLTSLSFSSNNLQGSLPAEIGKLQSLNKLHIDSSGLSGEIPAELGHLTRLEELWAFDNEFSGSIPDFFGNLTSLTDLRIQGTRLQGPIPSSLVALRNLQILRLGDISSGGSLQSGLKDLQNLTTLSLRNNGLSGKLLAELGELTNLQYLDLSFNNLTGEIPVSFGNLTSLRYLLLGNNNLTGEVPPQLDAIKGLTTLDLSYNQLSGTLPSWISNSSRQVNWAGNFFNVSDFNNSPTIAGLKCLQQNFPCNRSAPFNSAFGLNCGDGKLTSSTGRVFEADDETLGGASFYVNSGQTWGVSNTGIFLDDDSSSFVVPTTTQTSGTIDSGLYQKARASASSLKFYGLGLENGMYIVQLYFAEIVITDIVQDKSWRSLGRRIFDVYIQGKRELQDFNIKDEAKGSFQAVVKTFKVEIKDRFLEIHLFWSGKGTCCIPSQVTYGPLISAIQVEAELATKGGSAPTTSAGNKSTRGNKSNGAAKVIGIIAGALVGALALCCGLTLFWRRKKDKALPPVNEEEEEFWTTENQTNMFTYNELKVATGAFHPQNKLGEGGFGAVFKGVLPDGTMIAVKQLSTNSRQRSREFMNEIVAISSVQHRNLVKLLGCCLEGDQRLLVFEFLENNNLAHALFGTPGVRLELNWPTRYNICLGTARGLAYLHEESHVRIIHRDIKASNILLDKNLNAKIADFGLAKLFEEDKSHVSTRVAGTFGYLAPEYAMSGQLTEKADVFSFGVLTLELISGRRNMATDLSAEKSFLLEWTWQLYEENKLLELVDPKLIPSYNQEEVWRVLQVALLCTQAVPAMRPPMSRVVAMLTGHAKITGKVMRPGFLADWNQSAAAGAQQAYASSSVGTSSSGGKSTGTTSSSFTKSSITYSVVEAR